MYFILTLKSGLRFSKEILLSLLLIIIVKASTGIRTREECDNLASISHCFCSPSIDEFEVQCVAENLTSNIIIRIRPNNHVYIECTGIYVKDYVLLPKINVGNIPTVQFRQCPLPGSGPLSYLLEYLGITGTRNLLFESTNLPTNLTRQHLSELKGLERLHFKIKTSTFLSENLFVDFENLLFLELRFWNTQLPDKIFNPLKNLKVLSLGDSGLKALKPGIFGSLRKLRSLNLWSNQLRNLSKDVFQGVSSITDLDISSNGIEKFQPDVFSLLGNLSNLRLNANALKSLPLNLFENNNKLTQVHLVNNRAELKSLPSKLFANLMFLKEIRLTCSLESVPHDLFANSTALTTLEMVRNELRYLPEGILKDQHNLRYLDLSRNRLKKLPEQLFSSLQSLEVLKVSHNQLLNISSKIFASLQNLRELYIDNNHIIAISSKTFINTPNIQIINMENNQINLTDDKENMFPRSDQSEFYSPFQYLLKLQTLNLKNNSVAYIYSDWAILLVELQALDLSYNSITSLDYSDLQFVSGNGVNINLTHNEIEIIDLQKIMLLNFDDRKGKLYLDLNNNPLNCDCRILAFVQYLQGEIGQNLKGKIELNANELVCGKPESIKGKNVVELDPRKLVCPFDLANSGHCPRGCDCWVRLYDYVLEIKCEKGNLTEVPELPLLGGTILKNTELFIENNNLSKLPSVDKMLGYENVTRIYAHGNKINEINVNELPTKLKLLDLRYNQLRKLTKSVLETFNRSNILKEIFLSGNPWTCDCINKPLLQFAKNNYKRIQDYSQIRCDELYGSKKFEDLSIADVCRSEKSLPIVFAMVISMTGILMGVFAALYYKYQHEIKIWLYANNLCLWFVTEDELDKNKEFDAFISYSHKDEKFVGDYLVPHLEKGPVSYKLCLHERDWKIGECIPDQILRSVDNSRRTIIVMSQNFISSGWARMEFRAAHQAALNEKRARVIVIIYGEIENIEALDNDLKAYLKMNTYLKWGDPWFWSKLRYAMPHSGSWLSETLKAPIKNCHLSH